MSKIIKLQVPIKEELREIGEMLARQEGLSSYQELIRYWTMQAYQGKLYIDGSQEIVAEKAARYKAEADKIRNELTAGKRKGYNSVDDLIDSLDSDDADSSKA